MARVLVTETIAASGLQSLRDAGHEVREAFDLSPAELRDAVADADALIVRSATQVTAEVIDASADLAVVGRAGVGVDNIDIEAATAKGILVANAPESNVISAAEHAMALILAMARNVPQAHMALVDGRWERSQWVGIELSGKTLGIVGLGRVGRLVARRAQAFDMDVLAHDPFVSAAESAELGCEWTELEDVFVRSDFVTLHLARTPETVGLVGSELLARSKRGVRVINVSRGGIVDEQALAAAIRDGQVAGAALDVFDTEPTTESPLFGLPEVVVTPHLGASTREAQEKAGVAIAEQVLLALAGDPVPFAVNGS